MGTIRSLRQLTLVAIVFLTGCAATGPKFTSLESAGSNTSVVYIYRVSSFAGGGSYPKLTIDGADDLMLKNGGYVRRVLPAGTHRFVLGPRDSTSSFSPMELVINTENGKTYFARYKIVHRGADSTTNPGAPLGAQVVFHHKFAYYFEKIEESVALTELKETRSLGSP